MFVLTTISADGDTQHTVETASEVAQYLDSLDWQRVLRVIVVRR